MNFFGRAAKHFPQDEAYPALRKGIEKTGDALQRLTF
jgi:hypothetical protein